MKHSSRALIFVAVILASVPSLASSAAPAAAAEVQTHVYDANLSLTGNCAVSGADPIPDPGCPDPPHPPSGRFNLPRSIAIDNYGDIYVASTPPSQEGGAVDVFSANGHFITELNAPGPQSVAVDSKGYVYVYSAEPGPRRILRCDPQTYEPTLELISYEPCSTVVLDNISAANISIAVDLSSDVGHADHLYVDQVDHINEYGSALEGNPLLSDTLGLGALRNSKAVTVDPTTHDIYASDTSGPQITTPSVVRVFNGQAPGYPLERTITGGPNTGPACPPLGRFAGDQGYLSIAVDTFSGHVFIYDAETATKAVYEFDETGTECISKTEKSFSYLFGNQIAIDNGSNSPNGDLNSEGRYLYVPTGATPSESHVWAFEPIHLSEPPSIEDLRAEEVGTSDAELHASINPNSAATHYVFEYTTQAEFESESEKFENAEVAGEGDLPIGSLATPVSATIAGLSPGTQYRFRLRAENACETETAPCQVEKEATFTTFEERALPPCPKDALRATLGGSIALPDCRAYELVSPPDTAAKELTDSEQGDGGDRFGSYTVTESGDRAVFATSQGSLPGTEAGGSFNGSVYFSSRDPQMGWNLETAGPTGAQLTVSSPGGLSPDLDFMTIAGSGSGSLMPEGPSFGGEGVRFIRKPDGQFELVGVGSLDTDLNANVRYLSPGGTHVIFRSTMELEADSPASGTKALYDRSVGGPTHLVSYLPNEVTPTEDALYLGSSVDGSSVAFLTGSTVFTNSPLYVRRNNQVTLEAAEPGATFGGFSTDGRYVLYQSAGGDLFRLDMGEDVLDRLTTSGDATAINFSADGGTVYFVSPSVLTGTETNPNGAVAQSGEENLYAWSGGAVAFVGTVTARDVEGKFNGVYVDDGLGLWNAAQASRGLAIDPSRSTADGATLLFESRANLGSYDSAGKAEIYRYSVSDDSLTCISCNPTGSAASGDASLQTSSSGPTGHAPVSQFTLLRNLRPDGQRAFFQSPDGLVPTDTDGFQDVYEWEAAGVGSCTRPGGCVYLVSSGASAHPDYLYGVSGSGDDVFISTTDRLLARDADHTGSIYDARVDGGFVEPTEASCEGEGCRPQLTGTPPAPGVSSQTAGESGNVSPRKRCGKGKHAVRRKGKSVCVKKKHRHHKNGGARK
jgi:hypothetical protein